MPRTIQDEEVQDMIDFLSTCGMGKVIVGNLTVMLQELLKLRKKVRNDATA